MLKELFARAHVQYVSSSLTVARRASDNPERVQDILNAIVVAQERGFRVREKMRDPQFISVHLVDAFIQNTIRR